MAGASSSGDEVETGRTNRGESATKIWADVPPGQPNFNGNAIFVVEVAGDAEDDDDYEDGDSFLPSNAFHGLTVSGWSGGSASNFGGSSGAHGVVARGGRHEGTGVVGLGGGSPEPGNGGAGGVGVHGLGGPQADFFIDPTIVPGTGVIGQGGRQSDRENVSRMPHAAGMIAIGGGIGRTLDLLPFHPLTETGGVGLYAQGAEQTITMVAPSDATGTIPGPDVPSGPPSPGPGVVGRGGIPIPPEGAVAAGVIGLAGGTPLPDISETGNTGVYGAGSLGVYGRGDIDGVRGISSKGNGVYGISNAGRGGMFETARSAQVQLVPMKTPGKYPAPAAVTPTALPAGREGLQLPKDGLGGDLLTLMDDQRLCTLWFCVHSADGSGAAQWAQVLLGPSFTGTA